MPNVSTADIVIMLLFVFLLILFGRFRFRRKRIGKIDAMNGVEFEHFLKSYFVHEGYRVSLTKTTGDFGADLILKKRGIKIVVQAKRYNNKVGLSAVQEAVSAIKYYKANKAMVVTNNYFTSGAKTLAKANHVTLWDRDTLLKKMAK